MPPLLAAQRPWMNADGSCRRTKTRGLSTRNGPPRYAMEAMISRVRPPRTGLLAIRTRASAHDRRPPRSVQSAAGSDPETNPTSSTTSGGEMPQAADAPDQVGSSCGSTMLASSPRSPATHVLSILARRGRADRVRLGWDGTSGCRLRCSHVIEDGRGDGLAPPTTEDSTAFGFRPRFLPANSRFACWCTCPPHVA